MSYPPPGEPDQPPSPYEPPGRPGDRSGWDRPSDSDQWGRSGEQPQWGQSGDQPQWGRPEHPQWGQQPPYPPQGPYGQYGPPPGGGGGPNALAILSLVFAFVFAPAGIVLGHLAKRQIRRSGEPGDQLATWGLILSYVFTAIGLLICCGWIALAIWANPEGGNTYN
ncbi:DUF4190 domain-containing protein [Micromonospora psammae]|uniref:DUF4190 domain-containing protein n=1 Tax=Micromonospora sp. CPCC 205556 TaxID=3122398 RepID=UPI002FF16EB7